MSVLVRCGENNKGGYCDNSCNEINTYLNSDTWGDEGVGGGFQKKKRIALLCVNVLGQSQM